MNPVVCLLAVGCLAASGVSAAKLPTVGNLHGTIENGIYISPDSVFRVRVPLLAEAGAHIADEAFGFGYQTVRFTDDLCRQFVVTRQTVSLEGLSLSGWANRRIVTDLKRQKIAVAVTVVDDSRNGPLVQLTYRRPRGAPCTTVQMKEGEELTAAPDASIIEYLFYAAGSLYRVSYVLGDIQEPGVPAINGVNRGPAEKVAAQFVEGFEILRKSEKK